MTWFTRWQEAVLSRLPSYRKLDSRCLKLEQALDAASIRAGDLQSEALRLHGEMDELRGDLRESHGRELEIREKWIESLEHRGIFSDPDGMEPPTGPPERIPGRPHAARLARSQNRKFLQKFARKAKG